MKFCRLKSQLHSGWRSLLSKEDVDDTVKPYVGKRRILDVQRALEAIEALFASAVTLRCMCFYHEQELELGIFTLEVTESRLVR